jgi:hypothetical protein
MAVGVLNRDQDDGDARDGSAVAPDGTIGRSARGVPRIGRPSSGDPGSAPQPDRPSKPQLNQAKRRSTAKSPSGLGRRPRTGLRAAKSRLFLRGLATVDKRTVAARSYVTTRQALLDHLGGAESVSETQAQLVELVSRGLLYVGHLDAVLLERRSLLNKKGTKVVGLLIERMRMSETVGRQLAQLGLQRVKPPIMDLQTYLSDKYAQHPHSAPGEMKPGGPGAAHGPPSSETS